MKPEAVTSLHLFKPNRGVATRCAAPDAQTTPSLPRASQAPCQDLVGVWSGPVYPAEVVFYFEGRLRRQARIVDHVRQVKRACWNQTTRTGELFVCWR